MAEIKVKALINKEKNKVVYVEANADFVDMLFSFLTMPMGTIVRLTSKLPWTTTIGSMNNLYKSVENLSANYFQTSECKEMLLRPRSGAEAHLKKTKLTLDNYSHFFCCGKCTSTRRLMSYYRHTPCPCGYYMDNPICVPESGAGDENGGVLVKGLGRYLISDELEIFPLSTTATFSQLLKQDVSATAVEEKEFSLGKLEILNLLKSLLVSKNPLTETLLKNCPVKEANKEFFDPHRAAKKRKIGSSSQGNGNFRVKRCVSKSRNVVCLAEAGEDFIELLLSFLTIPLGNILKEMQIPSEGCARHLHESVQKLDARNLISDEIKQLLLSPEVAQHFGFHKELLDLKEANKQYYCTLLGVENILVGDKSLFKNAETRYRTQKVKLLDPKSSSCKNKAVESSGGYVKGATMFTMTDDLDTFSFSIFLL